MIYNHLNEIHPGRVGMEECSLDLIFFIRGS